MRCADCGAETDEAVDIVKDGEVVAAGVMCGVCLGWHLGRIGELRDTFESLLADGLGRAEANRIMIQAVCAGAAS